MPRVHRVKKARKDYPKDGIKKGESYFWWKFNYGPKIRSKTEPKPKQLTRSDFWIAVYEFQESIETCSDKDELTSIIDDIRALADEQEEKKNNMPDSLQEGSTGELLSGRQDSLNEWADALDAVDEDADDFTDAVSGIEYNGE